MFNPLPNPPNQQIRTVPVNAPRIKTEDASGTIVVVPLSSSMPDGFSIVAVLQSLVDQYGRTPGIRSVAIGLLQSLGNHDVESHVNALTQWVMDKVIYTADPDGAELFIAPNLMINDIVRQGYTRGDCDDHVMLLGSLLVSIGVPVRVNGVKINEADYYNHVMLSAMVNGHWQDIDPCVKDGWQPHYQDMITSYGNQS